LNVREGERLNCTRAFQKEGHPKAGGGRAGSTPTAGTDQQRFYQEKGFKKAKSQRGGEVKTGEEVIDKKGGKEHTAWPTTMSL